MSMKALYMSRILKQETGQLNERLLIRISSRLVVESASVYLAKHNAIFKRTFVFRRVNRFLGVDRKFLGVDRKLDE
jgi:hypothetical protein